MRVGLGYDLHKLVPERDLVIGGVTLPYHLGEEAHSDGDVLIHAIIDSLFGALALGDIGTHFPPSDNKWKNISSMILLEECYKKVVATGYKIGNIDCTIILERPKIKPYVLEIRENISKALNIPLSKLSIKGKTKEGVDATGENRAIEAHVISLLL
ncbi:2-C-methyl-D-erythritol 2,4-cyclodiphosphate synthase [Thiospirochaeta perfilievii]|uniref:2-C-methyl-D-erythritol 2,4-cyclodiphosphate synthase n=1 Tax=Thiospirochaeta perfilievii TaxID=252967 RepID=A0A5C1QE86_9SPIO|nr:2-C-methyl-D-erythritol 2,4-cyclodiphosphate synthase [Thiospirochaeta perfilievii]QEN06373.1 2-C-methyl-D-erythritol 2,4-cyclodiphosphate synthase [Thiospirochaeta perfilievii]